MSLVLATTTTTKKATTYTFLHINCFSTLLNRDRFNKTNSTDNTWITLGYEQTDEISTLNKEMMTATTRYDKVYAMTGNVDDCEKAEPIGT